TSTATHVAVGPAPTPSPLPTPVPELRCDLPAGGTVAWGENDTSNERRGVARLDATTADGLAVTSKEVYSPSTLVLTEPGADPVTLGARLRVRGNSTSMVSIKYPYKVKLDARTGVLGMPASKDFVLLANFFDRSLLRNDVGFEIARRLGAPWVPRMQQVDLYLNGTYKGLYQWGEGIETEADRVALEDGGVLLEADSYDDTDPHFTTARDLRVFVKSSQEEDVVTRTSDRVRLIEDVLYSDHYADPVHGYRACLDVDSFVDAYLVAELTKNIDAAFNNSVWMVLGADGRLAMGPAWDFDQGMGNRHNCEISEPQGWFVARDWAAEQPVTPRCFPTQMRGPQGHWYQRLLTDPWFALRVRTRWVEVRDSLATLPEYVQAGSAAIRDSAERTFAPAPGGAGNPVTGTILEPAGHHVFHGSWAAESTALTDWLRARIAWLDAQLG
ncbi:CotH kinase family protein, partial [Aeromicrobium sp.]|uniref:CotH kinase family protein n=1 Tax=Aeromicrobium sp. TaxID=1871063 RepID=UPI0028AE9975